MRLQIGLFGRTNVGKSSFLNLIAGQDVSLISAAPGTTTDVVEKAMELLPLGPVNFLDTGGLDDASEIGDDRAVPQTANDIAKAARSTCACLMVPPVIWNDIIKNFRKNNTVTIVPEDPRMRYRTQADAKEPERHETTDLPTIGP